MYGYLYEQIHGYCPVSERNAPPHKARHSFHYISFNIISLRLLLPVYLWLTVPEFWLMS